jgi:hypothetical protein
MSGFRDRYEVNPEYSKESSAQGLRFYQERSSGGTAGGSRVEGPSLVHGCAVSSRVFFQGDEAGSAASGVCGGEL